MDLGEIIFLNRVLTSSERAVMISYLNGRWGYDFPV